MAELTPVTRRPRDAFKVEHLTDGRVVVLRPGVSYIFDTEAEAERFLAYVDARDEVRG